MSKGGRGKLPLATVKRIFKEALGEADVRVSDDAIQYLVSYLEEIVRKVAPIAYRIVANAGRKTIRRQEIETAIKALKESM